MARNATAGVSFVRFSCREKRHSLAIFKREEVAYLGALKITILRRSGKIAAAPAEARAILAHSVHDHSDLVCQK